MNFVNGVNIVNAVNVDYPGMGQGFKELLADDIHDIHGIHDRQTLHHQR
jgi:hypothetical protein